MPAKRSGKELVLAVSRQDKAKWIPAIPAIPAIPGAEFVTGRSHPKAVGWNRQESARSVHLAKLIEGDSLCIATSTAGKAPHYIPSPKNAHPYPEDRFASHTRGRSRMR